MRLIGILALIFAFIAPAQAETGPKEVVKAVATKVLTEIVINRDKLIPILACKLASHTTQWWIEQLERVAVPCGPVNTLEQVFDHPQIKHREMVRQVANQHGELIDTIASPINLSATPLKYNSASPDLGQHSYQVLSKNLNYSEECISKLFAKATVS